MVKEKIFNFLIFINFFISISIFSYIAFEPLMIKKPHQNVNLKINEINKNEDVSNSDEKKEEKSLVICYLISYLSLTISYLILFILGVIFLRLFYQKNLVKRIFDKKSFFDYYINFYDFSKETGDNGILFYRYSIPFIFENIILGLFIFYPSIFLLEKHPISFLFDLFKNKKFSLHWQEVKKNRDLYRNILGKYLWVFGSFFTVILYVFIVPFLVFFLAAKTAFFLFPEDNPGVIIERYED